MACVRLSDILTNFKGKKIAVIGDLMLDEYIEGDVSRISPEAPVPVLKVGNIYYQLGGAGNVASNLVTLGGECTICSFIGDDHYGGLLKSLLEKQNISHILEECDDTTVKTRVVSRGHQLVRYDREDSSRKQFNQVSQASIRELMAYSDIVILSDYAKGVVSQELFESLRDYWDKMVVNAKPANAFIQDYSGAKLIVLNRRESQEMSGKSDPEEGGKHLREKFGSNVLITLSEEGMMLFSDRIIKIPTYAKKLIDVQGAGDTVVASVALSLAAGSTLEEAAILGNHAAGIAIGEPGTYSVKFNELESRVMSRESKIVNFDELEDIVEGYRKNGKRIVWTNGCFDILHTGHTRYLKKARELGDVLVVGLDSDDSVRRLKGEGRPLQPENERAELLSSIESVDHVTIFSEMPVSEYLKRLSPDVYVKGGDYTLDTINQAERKIVESYGGKISLINVGSESHTSSIIERIRNGGLK